MEKELKNIYEDPANPGSLGGVNRLLSSAKAEGLKVNRRKVLDYLKGNETYTMHKPIHRHIIRNPTIVKGIDSQWQADLADMNDVVKFNDGYRYMLTVIDCFSKFAWVLPVKNKDANTVAEAFKHLFEQAHPRKPGKIQTDKGKEFFNKQVQALFKKLSIQHFATENETKAAMVERFNRTIKTRIWAYFTNANTKRYLEVLPKIVDSYNHSVHRTIGVRPIDVNKNNEEKIWHRVYGKDVAMARSLGPQVEAGSNVRISKQKHVFEKGYLPNWTGEIFKVVDSKQSKPKKVYKLQDYSGETITGTFYPEEILQIIRDKDAPWAIEKIIKTKKDKSGTQHLVKWLHWPDKFNSWVSETDLKQLQNG